MSELSDIARAPSRVGTGWGFAVMLLGMLAIMAPFVSGVAVTATVAVLITAAGLAMTMYAFKAGSLGRGVVRLLFGGITIVAGTAIIGQPQIALATLTLFLAVYFVVDGISMSFASASMPAGKARTWVLINSLLTLMLGVLIWSGWPLSGVWAIGVLVGVRLIFSGMTMMALGSAARDFD